MGKKVYIPLKFKGELILQKDLILCIFVERIVLILMRSRILFFCLLAVLPTGLFAQDWVVQRLNSGTLEIINAVHFPNPTTGYAVTQGGLVLKTADSGLTWSKQFRGGAALRSVHFLNSNTGYYAGDDGIFKTTNGGVDWMLMTTGYFRSVHFVSIDVGYACGTQGYGYGVSKTTDGGKTWTQCFNQGSTANLFLVDAKEGYAAQWAYPFKELYKTVNSGTSWTTINIPDLKNGFSTVFFTDKNTGYVGEWYGGLFKTTDGGDTWTKVEFGTAFKVMSVHFTDSNTGFAAGGNDPNSIIMSTVDAGKTWTKIFDEKIPQVTLIDMSFPDSNTGFVTGNIGVILRISPPGTQLPITQPVITGLEQITEDLFQVSPNPSRGDVVLSIPSSTKQVIILNVLGQVVQRIEVDNQTSLRVSIKDSGINFVQVVTATEVATRKVIIGH